MCSDNIVCRIEAYFCQETFSTLKYLIFLGVFFIFKNLLIFIPHGWQIWKSHKIHEDSLTSCTMGTLRSWPCCVQEQLSWELPSIYFTGNGTDILPKLQHIWPKKRMSRNVSCWIGTSEFRCSSSVLYFGLWKSVPHFQWTHKTFCSTPVVFQNLCQRKGGQIYCYFVTMLGESKENPYTLGKKKTTKQKKPHWPETEGFISELAQNILSQMSSMQ